jgi:hypothetical protein
MLKLKDGLKILEQLTAAGRPKPFSIVFVTADVNRGTGGDVIEYPRAILSRLRRLGRPAKSTRPGKVKSGIQYHAKNRTRNICALGSSEIRKLHIDLILEINGHSIA